jgi:hypothetical protein
MLLAEKIISEVAHAKQAAHESLFTHLQSKYDIVHAKAGGYGWAGFTSDNKKVIKVTTDKSEVHLALRLQGKNVKHYANVYNIWKYASNGAFRVSTPWVYIIEKENIPYDLDEDEILLDCAFQLYSYILDPTEKKYNQFAKGKTLRQLITEINYIANSDQDLLQQGHPLYYAVSKFYKPVDEIIEFYLQYKEMRKELNRYQITDLSPKNIGYKEGGILAGFDFESNLKQHDSTFKKLKNYTY